MLIKRKLKKRLLVKKPLKEKSTSLYIDKSKLLDHIDLHKFLKTCLMYLNENNIIPRIEETKQIIKQWNKVDNSRFVRHNVNLKGITFQIILTLVSYRMSFNDASMNTIFDGIRKFNFISNSNGLLLYKKKLKLADNFLYGLSKYNDKSWFDICTMDDTSTMSHVSGININFKNTFERVKKAYINNFHEEDAELGRAIALQNATMFILFSEKLVEYHKNKVMCEYRNNFKKLIYDYFEFAREAVSNSKVSTNYRISYILSQKLLLNFVMKVRNEPSMSNFFSDMKKKQ